MSENSETAAMERLLAISRESNERQTELMGATAEEMKNMIALMKVEMQSFQESRQLLEDFIAGIDKPIQQMVKATAALIQLYQLQQGQYNQSHQ